MTPLVCSNALHLFFLGAFIPDYLTYPQRTYLALLRLQHALSTFQSDKVTFTLQFAPYQLYPEFNQEGEDKYAC